MGRGAHTELGLVKVVALDTAQDVGKAINPDAVDGQIHGGSAQGMGLALMEEVVVTDGHMRNPPFTDYLLRTILDMPPMRVQVLEYADPERALRRPRGGGAADHLLRPGRGSRGARRLREAAAPGADPSGARHRDLADARSGRDHGRVSAPAGVSAGHSPMIEPEQRPAVTATVDVPVPTLVGESVVVEPDAVRILDRRVFPFERTWVTCRSHEDVARAIEEMVTQSLGPLFAAAGGMTLAAREADRLPTARARQEYLTGAGRRLVATRPTNNAIRDVVAELLTVASATVDAGDPPGAAVERAARAVAERHRAGHRRLGEHAAALIPDGATVLTHCWAESYLTETVAAVLRSGKRIDAVCTETRPYLQGARLTAESLAEMGVPTRLVTDGMPAHLMSRGDVTTFVTGADRVTMDGSVVNKIGTLQIAVAAHTFGVPYLALVQAPDRQAPDASAVELEDRDGREVLQCLGHRTASESVTGVYPAFDVTPPRFVSVVVTDRGRFAPPDVASYFAA